jgi:hypothetical protein
MAAGLGFKTFTTGEVLTAADTNGYLMQGILVFASATARDAAITSPQEGQFAYLKDTNVTTYYTGSAWANVDTTGMTNPMTTTGDIIYSSPGSTPVRLGIGTANQVLSVNSGATAPEWKTPAAGGGGKVLQVVSATTTTSTTISSSTYTDTTITPTLATSKILILIMANNYGEKAATGQSQSVGMKLLRGATTLFTNDNAEYSSITGSTAQGIQRFTPITYYDNPATTSATTYKLQGQIQTVSGGTSVWQGSSTLSTITLLEIGA